MLYDKDNNGSGSAESGNANDVPQRDTSVTHVRTGSDEGTIRKESN